MYKKTIKRGGREYTYYYQNYRVNGRVKNVCLGTNYEEAKKKILDKVFTKEKLVDNSGKDLQNYNENPLHHIELLSDIPNPKKEIKGFARALIIIFIILFSAGFFYYFNVLDSEERGLIGSVIDEKANLKISGRVISSIESNLKGIKNFLGGNDLSALTGSVVSSIEVNSNVSEQAYFLLVLDNKEYKQNISEKWGQKENRSYQIREIDLSPEDFNVNLEELPPGEYSLIYSLVDKGEIIFIESDYLVITAPEDLNETIEEPIEPIIPPETNITEPSKTNETEPPEINITEPVDYCDMYTDCGVPKFVSEPYCYGNIAVRDKETPYCPANHSCGSSVNMIINKTCLYNETCYLGACLTNKEYNLTINKRLKETFANKTILNITTPQTPEIKESLSLRTKIIAGKPIRYTKTSILNEIGIIEIPTQAKNISVFKVENNERRNITDKAWIKKEDKIFEEKLEKIIEEEVDGEQITGGAIFGNERNGLFFRILNDFFSFGDSITGGAVTQNKSENITLRLENTTEGDIIEISYELEAPKLEIEDISEELRRVVISSDYHYENVTSRIKFTDPANGENQKFKVYRNINGTKEEVKHIEKDTDHNQIYDTVEWEVPHLSEEEYFVELIILNIQSYPIVGDEWTVEFNVTGKANLTISAIKETTYEEIFIPDLEVENDLRIKSLKCGSNTLFDFSKNFYNETLKFIADGEIIPLTYCLNQSCNISAIYLENYSCENQVGTYTVDVLTEGKHHQEFDFGGLKQEANNYAGYGYWWNDTFSKCKNIEISRPAGSSTTLTDFPLYIKLENFTANGGGDSEEMNEDFKDIRFTDAVCSNGGTELDFEIEDYHKDAKPEGDGGVGPVEAYVWVRIPTLIAAGTTISMYYSNTSAVEEGNNSEGVWDQYYISVQHFNGDGGNEAVMDGSTSYDVDYDIKTGNLRENQTIDGAFYMSNGYAIVMDADVNTLNQEPQQELTLEMVINSTAGVPSPLSGEGSTWASMYFWSTLVQDRAGWNLGSEWFDYQGFKFDIYNNSPGGQSTVGDVGDDFFNQSINKTAFVTATFSGDDYVGLYLNGTLEDSLSGEADVISNIFYREEDHYDHLALGARAGNQQSKAIGYYDEFRYSNISRSAEWVEMFYQNIDKYDDIVSMTDHEECDVDGDCKTGQQCIGGFCFYQRGRFVIQNSTGDNLTFVDRSGRWAVRGNFTQLCTNPAPAGSFKIVNQSDDAMFWVHPSDGWICLNGGRTIHATTLDTYPEVLLATPRFRITNDTNNLSIICSEVSGVNNAWLYMNQCDSCDTTNDVIIQDLADAMD